MKNRRFFSLSICIALCVVALAALLVLVGDPARAQATTRYVATTGTDVGGCSDPGNPCRTVQYAVDQATGGDLIKVATGTYDDVNSHGGLAQVVYIDKTVIIRGGYAPPGFADPPDPETNPTTLDAQEQGRVVYIAGDPSAGSGQAISPTLEGLRITGGDGDEFGGGVYIISATATISNSQVFSNSAQTGGGLHLENSSSTLTGNNFSGNTATGWNARGGGLSLVDSDATLSGNIISDNIANGVDAQGGGLLLVGSAATLSGNTISDNAVSGATLEGGGLWLEASAATLSGNTVSGNAGGGLYLKASPATLNSNTISGNGEIGLYLLNSDLATLSDNVVSDNDGRGLYLSNSHGTTLSGNTISGNAGTGLYLSSCEGTIVRGNTIRGNAATGFETRGGGVFLDDSEATLINNIVADNQAGEFGSGLYIDRGSTRLLHTTIARNTGGDGSGVYVTGGWPWATVWLTNTILAGQTFGIIGSGGLVRLEGTLWGDGAWSNGTDWLGGILTGTVNVWGDPEFVDPAGGDYHIGPGSAAVDAGVDSGVATDIDGEPRPSLFAYDIGADERTGASLSLHKAAWPTWLNGGQVVTYTMDVGSVWVAALTNIRFTDTLPAEQHVVDIFASQGSCAPGTGWGGSATCDLGTMVPGASARITLTAQVTTTPPAQVPWPMQNRAWVKASETMSSTASAETMLQDCRARLNDDPTEYGSVQGAVDASSQPGDVVKVAGYCAAVSSREGVVQIVHLNKTLKVQGGWNSTFTARDVVAFPTTLDARGQGRVLYITAPAPGTSISPTVEGLHITGGDATGQGGGPDGGDAGGGVYVISATATFSGNQVVTNTASHGGGLYLADGDATLSGNAISGNSADQRGGGLYLSESEASLSNNTITGNAASVDGYGGGLYLSRSPATLSSNAISGNSTDQGGGGLYLSQSEATLSENTVTGNAVGPDGYGGGLYLDRSPATLSGNTFSDNDSYERGGGLYLSESDAALNANTITGNSARLGAGLYLSQSGATLNGNTVASNTAGTDLSGYGSGSGGGLYLDQSPATLSNNTITANAATGDYGTGGGLYLGSSDATLSSNTITNNTSDGDGGGLYLGWPATVIGNTISDNAANHSGGGGSGGGVYGAGTLSGNTIAGNTAEQGGGLYLVAAATLKGNTIISNTADHFGGGAYLHGSDVTLTGNTISDNWAMYGGGVYGGGTLARNTIAGNTAGDWGGGLLVDSGPATISANTVHDNTAASGGGLFLISIWREVTVSGNRIFSNTAQVGGGLEVDEATGLTIDGNKVFSNTASIRGGGLFLAGCSDVTVSGNIIVSNTSTEGGGLSVVYQSSVTLANNIIADNQAHSAGSGLYIAHWSHPSLIHTTIARNHGGDGSGVHVSNYSGVALTNTILVSHTFGITVASSCSASLESTLWHGNSINWFGAGTINRSSDYSGDPAFVDLGAGDYHIGPGSAAIDRGLDIGVLWDIDHEPRFDVPDLGADEYWPPGVLGQVYLPLVFRNGP